MGFFDTIGRGLERKAALTGPGGLDLWAQWFGSSPVKSGVSVNAQTALQTTAVFGCVRRIAEALTIPRKVYNRDKSGNRVEARDHPLFDIIASKPNDVNTGIEFFEAIAIHVCLMFNAYVFINRAGGKIVELIPIEPGRVEPVPRQNEYGIDYRVRLDGRSSVMLDSSEVWHLRGPSWDGLVGMDAIKLAREAVGLAIATEETHARFHSNGGHPGGVFSTDNTLSKEAKDQLRAYWENNVQGVNNKFKNIVLDNGLKWQSLMMNGVDAQHLETRRFQVEEVCRFYGVFAINIGPSDKTATYASAEQMFNAHLVHTVRPWTARVAESMDRWLLTDKERKAGYYTGFVEAAFLQPSMVDQATYYKTAVGGPWLTANEARGHQELPKRSDGDKLNPAPGSGTGQPAGDGAAPADAGKALVKALTEIAVKGGFNPLQDRDDHGRWSDSISGGGDGAGDGGPPPARVSRSPDAHLAALNNAAEAAAATLEDDVNADPEVYRAAFHEAIDAVLHDKTVTNAQLRAIAEKFVFGTGVVLGRTREELIRDIRQAFTAQMQFINKTHPSKPAS